MKLTLFITITAMVVFVCTGALIRKRDAEQTSVVSDASQTIDKLLDDIGKGIKQLATDKISFDSILQNITAKASEFGEQLQTFGKDIGTKVEEAAKKQGIAS